MAATGTPTPNIGLRIPQGTDPASVDDINYNSNLLDTKLGAVGETSVQDQIDSLNSKLTPTTGTVDTTTATTHNTTECNSLIKTANIVNLKLLIHFDAGYEQGVSAFATVPSVFRPSANKDIPMLVGKSTGIILAKGRVKTDGTIVQDSTSSGVKDIWIDTAYEL